MQNPDNNALIIPIGALNPFVTKYANSKTGLTRADIWTLATVVAVDVGHHVKTSKPVSFPFNYYGRVNCEVANKVCYNATGATVPCSSTAGPHRTTPSANLNTSGLFAFFADSYGFSKRQSVAIMGGHAVGAMDRFVSDSFPITRHHSRDVSLKFMFSFNKRVKGIWHRRTERICPR